MISRKDITFSFISSAIQAFAIVAAIEILSISLNSKNIIGDAVLKGIIVFVLSTLVVIVSLIQQLKIKQNKALIVIFLFTERLIDIFWLFSLNIDRFFIHTSLEDDSIAGYLIVLYGISVIVVLYIIKRIVLIIRVVVNSVKGHNGQVADYSIHNYTPNNNTLGEYKNNETKTIIVLLINSIVQAMTASVICVLSGLSAVSVIAIIISSISLFFFVREVQRNKYLIIYFMVSERISSVFILVSLFIYMFFSMESANPNLNYTPPKINIVSNNWILFLFSMFIVKRIIIAVKLIINAKKKKQMIKT